MGRKIYGKCTQLKRRESKGNYTKRRKNVERKGEIKSMEWNGKERPKNKNKIGNRDGLETFNWTQTNTRETGGRKTECEDLEC